tara:strand:+ start:2199 stop:2651 length:453 start_codon:yes stop_codon:yes gene_type:complete
VARSDRWGLEGLPYTFRSKFECEVANQLLEYEAIWEYETVTLPYGQTIRQAICSDCGSHNVRKRRRYTPDFKVMTGKWDLNTMYIEVKGRFPSTDRTKMIAVKECYPDLDIKMLFMRNNSTGETRHKTYGGWCDNMGFDWAVGQVPESWL